MGGGAAKTSCRVTATVPALTGLGGSDGYWALRPIRTSTFTGLWCRLPSHDLAEAGLDRHAAVGGRRVERAR